MPDALYPITGPTAEIRVHQAAFQQLDVILHRMQILTLAGGKIIQHAHGIPLRQQRFHDMRSYKPGPAGDESLHNYSCSYPI